jgi:hypothetical protein
MSTSGGTRSTSSEHIRYATPSSKSNMQKVLGAHVQSATLNRLLGVNNTQSILVDAPTAEQVHLSTASKQGVTASMRLFRVTSAGAQILGLSTGALVAEVPSVSNNTRTASSGRSLIAALQAMQAIGVQQVLMSAGRSDQMVGYDIWARLGAEGNTPIGPARAAATHFGAPYEQVSRVENIMSLPGGPAWWRRNGDVFGGVLDLRPGGRTAQILDRLGTRTARAPVKPATAPEKITRKAASARTAPKSATPRAKREQSPESKARSVQTQLKAKWNKQVETYKGYTGDSPRAQHARAANDAAMRLELAVRRGNGPGNAEYETLVTRFNAARTAYKAAVRAETKASNPAPAKRSRGKK